MNLAKDIVALLYDNDCVIVPQLGAFIANTKPAELNTAAKYVIINSRAIAFNSQIQDNDGLLANHISKKYNCSYNAGVKHVEKFVLQLNENLQLRKNAEIAQLGTFYRTKEEKLIFIPYHSINFNKKAYGLPKLRLQELELNKTIAAPAPVTPPPSSQKKDVLPSITRPKKIEAPLVADSFKEEKRKERTLLKQENVEDDRLAELAARRMNRHQRRQKANARMKVLNVLGALFMAILACGVLYTEFNARQSTGELASVVSLADTISSDKKELKEELNTPVVEPIKENDVVKPDFTTYAICIAKVNSRNKAVEIANNLNPKFAQSRTEENEDGSTGVFIISFTNQELALEYKEFLEQKLGQKLIIKTK